MSKGDFLWLGIRLAGLYLLILTLLNLPETLHGLTLLPGLWNTTPPDVVLRASRVLVYGAAGLYLFRREHLLHHILGNNPVARSS